MSASVERTTQGVKIAMPNRAVICRGPKLTVTERATAPLTTDVQGAAESWQAGGGRRRAAGCEIAFYGPDSRFPRRLIATFSSCPGCA